MSVVPPTGILRKHYEEAMEDIEHKSAAFWQVWLQHAFYERDQYAVVSESPPDESRRRADIVVKKYVAEYDTLSALLFVECKRPTGNVNQVEAQALNAAERCIMKDRLLSVYVMTTIGPAFRTWIVWKANPVLTPLHGGAEGDRDQYIDADSPYAEALTRSIDMIKSQPPLREAPTVPSQPIAGASTDWYQQAQAGPSSAQQSEGNFVEVEVKKHSHTFRPDEYTFKDSRGDTRSTTKDDWKRTKDAAGNRVWVYSGKRTSYFTRTKIE